MTKKQLVDAMSSYDDDQWVYVCVHSDEFPNGSQVVIQDIKTNPPWYSGEETKDLIGIVVHNYNKPI